MFSYEEWYEDSQQKERCAYKDGRLNGRRVKYREDGQVLISCAYKDGKIVG